MDGGMASRVSRRKKHAPNHGSADRALSGQGSIIMADKCRDCSGPLEHSFCDLGMSPLSNAFLTAKQLNQMERFYPLHAYVCAHCFLVQLQEFENPEQIFSDYAYFSSYSRTWLSHAKAYT